MVFSVGHGTVRFFEGMQSAYFIIFPAASFCIEPQRTSPRRAGHGHNKKQQPVD
jgi:hypothetical protein